MNPKLSTWSKHEELFLAYPIAQVLNPELSESDYKERIRRMVALNFKMVVALEDDQLLSGSGYWIGTKIYSGKYLEIDNFAILPQHRKKGLGQLILDYLIALAEKEGCAMMMLDAYIPNKPAHAFYERSGFVKRGYHMLKPMLGELRPLEETEE